MSKYIIDILEDGLSEDTIIIEYADFTKMRNETARALSDIAKDRISKSGGRRDFAVTARDNSGKIVYSAKLLFTDA